MFGLDYLGGAKYGNLILKEHPQGWAAGFFSNTFGDALPVTEALARTGRCPRIRLHLMWSDTHSYSEKDIPAIVKEAKRVLPVVLRNPSVEWRISPCCEHNLSYSSLRKIFDAIVVVFGAHVTYVNSPMRGAIEPTCVNEFHGTKAYAKPGRIDFSFDGDACVDADVEGIKQRFSSAETFYFWDARFNGKWEGNDATPRPQRKGWPDSALIDSIIYLSTSKGSTSIPKKWTYKSHSENKNGTDPRREKPVLLIPNKVSSVLLKTRNGQVVETLQYYGTYVDGRYRYYGSTMGYLTAQKAIRIQGDPMCEVWMNGKKQGVLNPGFRDGDYR